MALLIPGAPRGAAWDTTRTLALVTTLSTVAVAVMGSYVSKMGAGLACPDWPLCHGQVIPPLALPVILEWTHRLLALGVTLMLMTLVVLTWRQRRPERFVTLAAVLLLLAQASLGGLTVLLRLPPLVIAAHQGFAMLFFGALVVLTVRLYAATEVERRRGLRRDQGSSASISRETP